MKIHINYGGEAFALPCVKPELLAQADSADLKTLLLLASDPELRENCDSAALACRIGCRRDRAEASLRFWIETGIFSSCGCAPEVEAAESESKKPQKKLPSDGEPVYTGPELEALLDCNGGGRRKLLDECQNIAGKIFNTNEANKVVVLSDYLGLENEHILMLFAYCRGRGKTSVQYVYRTAYNLYNEGVDTLPKLEAYIKEKEAYESLEGKLRALFGFGDRSLTPNEREFIKRWSAEYGYPFEILERAYQVTVEGTRDNKFSIAYMNRVLEGWHNKNLSTLAQIDEELGFYKKKKELGGNGGGSFDTDEFYALAVKRTYDSVK